MAARSAAILFSFYDTEGKRWNLVLPLSSVILFPQPSHPTLQDENQVA
jgi:hypothetical protein